MAKRPSGSETTPPSFPETTPPRSFDMPAHTVQMIFEINGTVSRIDQKLAEIDKRVDTIRSDFKADHSGIDDRLREIEKHWHWVAGGIAVALIMIPIFGGIIWYSLGERIEAALQLNSGVATKP